MHREQGAFLIEIAIALIIVGLLFGGIAKASWMVANGQAKGLAADFRNVPVAIQTYHELYRAMPGDDAKASTHFGHTVVDGNADLRLQGRWNSARISDESLAFWQHLAAARLIRGDLTNAGRSGLPLISSPLNALGDSLGIQGLVNNGPPPILGLQGRYALCSQGIPPDIAHALDIALDDGTPDAGHMLAGRRTEVALGSAQPVSSFQDTGILTVCMGAG